jgi:predicted AAA+ superfamily ATPase
MFLPRQVDLTEATAHKSCFLFGPRQTGKSMLIRETLPKGTPVYELLDHASLESLLRRASQGRFVAARSA